VRIAVYYTPQQDDPLWHAGCAWTGRDPERDALLLPPDLPGITEITAFPRRYGFHATLKAPMRVVAGRDLFLRDVEALTSRLRPFPLPKLEVSVLDGFLALTASPLSPDLHDFADACVASLDRLRAPPDAAELQRRRAVGLTRQQEVALQRWGYPYVFATWTFHMTLTRRLEADEVAFWQDAVTAHFAPALDLPRQVTELSLFLEDSPGDDFRLWKRLKLRG
jgi:Protein of unknown function (DUF1045)